MRQTLLLLFTIPLMAVSSPSTERARIERLENSIMAPCCYQETVLRHQSEVAARMRGEIREWVAQGRTDREILDIFKQRHGARVLVEPEGSSWWWVHVIPLAALTLCTMLVIWLLIRWRARPRTEPVSDLPLPEWDGDLEDGFESIREHRPASR